MTDSTHRTLTIILLALMVAVSLSVHARGNDGRGGGQMSQSQAEDAARRQTGGGRVLSVKPADGGYQVKVLTPSGEVRYVFISGR